MRSMFSLYICVFLTVPVFSEEIRIEHGELTLNGSLDLAEGQSIADGLVLSKPVLVLFGSEDTAVPSLPAQMTVIRQDNIKYREIDGADHFFRDLYAYDVVDASLEFLGGL
jgi:alpha/beta superfamily hydrolase